MKNINSEEIKANIYDTISIAVDLNGIAVNDMKDIEDKVDEFLNEKHYKKDESSLLPEEIEDYDARNSSYLSIATKRRMLETEPVIRYFTEDMSEEIITCRLFVLIKLNYTVSHELHKKFVLISEIVNCYKKVKFCNIDKISLKKTNSIVTQSLYRFYQCFDKKMMGDCGYGLQSNDVDPIYLKNENRFKLKDTDVFVEKSIFPGIINEEGKKQKDAFCGKLIIETQLRTFLLKDVNIEIQLIELNKIILKIFLLHITKGFLQDLIDGNGEKVYGGVNQNGKRE